MCGISAQFLSAHQSVRLHGTISTIFFQPGANREPCAEFPLSLSTHQPVRLPGQRIDNFFSGRSSNRIASMGTSFSVRVIAHERHFRCRASAYSSNFWNAIMLELHETGMLPELRMSALCALHLKRVCFCFLCFVFCFRMVLYQVETSTILQFPINTNHYKQYCTRHMTAFTSAPPLYIKKDPKLNSTVLQLLLSRRNKYSTYAVTFVPFFSCLPREAPLLA